ncbi:MAG: hypothetical protein ABH858_06230 [Candidatus Omnitrophota bacterium]
MKKFFGCMIAVMLVVGLMGITGSKLLGPNESIAAEPVLSTATPLVQMSKKSAVVIMGSGFKPGQEIRILFATPDGLQSDVGYALKPAPKADNTGSWATTWDAGEYVGKKLIKGGA